MILTDPVSFYRVGKNCTGSARFACFQTPPSYSDPMTTTLASVQSLFTYTTLATLGGASLATALAVHAVGDFPGLRNVPRNALACGIATAILIVAMEVQRGLRLAEGPLVLLNGLLVTAAAVGTGHSVRSMISKPKGKGGS